MLNRNLLKSKQHYGAILDLRYRLQLVRIAAKEIGVREKTGNNDGERVEEYLAVTGLKKGQPYCSAFVSWVYREAGFAEPGSGWSPSLFPISRLTKSALPGNLIAVYFPELKRIAHVGMIEKLDGDWCISIEANTNIRGSNNGDGVYCKRRHVKTIYQMADWVKNGRRIP
ncbi:peptidoglycan-binding protein [Pedobacter sp. NJ-S-72]